MNYLQTYATIVGSISLCVLSIAAIAWPFTPEFAGKCLQWAAFFAGVLVLGTAFLAYLFGVPE